MGSDESAHRPDIPGRLSSFKQIAAGRRGGYLGGGTAGESDHRGLGRDVAADADIPL